MTGVQRIEKSKVLIEIISENDRDLNHQEVLWSFYQNKTTTQDSQYFRRPSFTMNRFFVHLMDNYLVEYAEELAMYRCLYRIL